jgi:hypothetical protein
LKLVLLFILFIFLFLDFPFCAMEKRSIKSLDKKLNQKRKNSGKKKESKIEASHDEDFDKVLKEIHQKKSEIQENLQALESEKEKIKNKGQRDHHFPKKPKEDECLLLQEKINSLINQTCRYVLSLEGSRRKIGLYSENKESIGLSQEIRNLQKNIRTLNSWLANKDYQSMAQRVYEVELQELKIKLNSEQDNLLMLVSEIIRIYYQNPKFEYLDEAENILHDVIKIDLDKFKVLGIKEEKTEATILLQKIKHLREFFQNPEKKITNALTNDIQPKLENV